MTIPRKRVLSLVSVIAAVGTLMLSACAARSSEGSGSYARAVGGVASSTQDSTQPLATIDGVAITLADLEELVGDELATLEITYGAQRSQLLQGALEQTIQQRLLESAAAAQGVGVQEMLAARIGMILVSDDEVRAWYEANRERLQGRPLEMLQPAIREFLTEQQQTAKIAELVDEIAADRDVEILLEPFRVEIDVEGHPSVGPENAPVVLVEFSDFECPYCGGFVSTLERVKDTYGDRVRLVYRQFPLTQIHANAMTAAAASLCAQEQGKFWELHDAMFAQQQRLTVADLQQTARTLGLDGDAFDACLASGRHIAAIEADMQLGQRLGVSGTPAMFVNGIPMDSGAVPYEALVELIDQELQRQGR